MFNSLIAVGQIVAALTVDAVRVLRLVIFRTEGFAGRGPQVVFLQIFHFNFVRFSLPEVPGLGQILDRRFTLLVTFSIQH